MASICVGVLSRYTIAPRARTLLRIIPFPARIVASAPPMAAVSTIAQSLGRLRRSLFAVFGAFAIFSGAARADTVNLNGLSGTWPASTEPQDATFLHAGFIWQGFNYDAGYGVGSTDEIILKNSNQTSSIAKASGLFDAVSIAAFTWVGDRTITFIGYRSGVEVARVDCFLPLVASASVPNPGTAFVFPAGFSGLDRLEIDPSTIATSSAGFDDFVYSTVVLDTTSTVTAGSGVTEPVALSTSADTAGEAVSVFDFTVTDAGSADGLSTEITEIKLSTSGTGNFAKVVWRLNGPDVSDVVGTYNSGTNTITFGSLSVSVANGGNETYTVSGYFADLSGVTNGQSYVLAVDGDSSTSFTVGAAGSQMAAGQGAVTNGTGTIVVDNTAPRVASVVRQNPAASPTSADTLVFRVTFSELMLNTSISTGDFAPAGTTATVTGVTSADYIVCDVTVTGGDLATLNGTVTLGFAGAQNLQDAAGNALTDTNPTGANDSYAVANNVAPVTSNLHGDSVGFSEGGSATLLDLGTNATITDSDSADFNGGVVTVSIVTNRVPSEDIVSVRNQGAGAGQVGVSGPNVTFGGVTIGTYVGGTGTNDLVITLNGSCTPGAAQALLRNLTYANSNPDAPSTLTRTVRILVNDGDGGTSANADVAVSVTGVNDAPTANTDNVSVAEDSSATALNVLANDSTAPEVGETLTVTSVTQPINGTVTLIGGVVSYLPAVNYNGSTSFTYTISDGNGGSATATVNVTVTPVNDLPAATADAFAVGTNSSATVLDVRANDSIAPDTGESLTITTVTQPANGTVTFTATNVSFTPAASFAGTTTFTYTISDGNGGTATATVTMTVENLAPTAISLAPGSVNQSAGANAVVGTLSATDANVGDTHVYTLVSGTGDTNNASFNISGSSLRATNATALAGGSYSVRVRVTDGGGLWCEAIHAVTVVDDVAPTISIGAPSQALIGPGPVSFTITYGGADTVSLATGHVTLNATGNAAGSVAVSGSGTTTRTVTLSSITGNGTLGISIASGSAADTAGNPAPAAGPSAIVAVDNISPTLTVPALSQIGANQVTLTLRSSETGIGYFTLLPGSGTAPGTGAQIKAGLDSTGTAAFRMGSLPLAANTDGTYTLRNLQANTAYTVCFTVDDGATVQPTPLTVSFTTAAATDLSSFEWVAVGAAGFSTGSASSTSLAFAPDGTPYVAYRDEANGSKSTVMKFSGGAWDVVGTAGFSAGEADWLSLAFAPDGTPYLAYGDAANGNKATVMKYSGGVWSVVDTAGFTAGSARYVSLAFASDGTPHVAYRDGPTQKAAVKKYSAGAWNVVGTGGFSANWADYTSLAFAPDGTPYVAYSDGGNGARVTVMNYSGGTWNLVGTAGFSAPGAASYTSLAFAPDGTPHVAYQTATGAKMMSYSGGTWNVVGPPTISAGGAFISLAFAPDGAPYVAYWDGMNGLRATVMKYSGGVWNVAGTAGFSAGEARNNSLAFAPDGTPYVAYRDVGNGNKATVMKLMPPPVVSSVAAPAGATYVAGGYLDFTVTFDSAVTVTGAPRLTLNIGATTRYAAYASGSGTTALVFRYTIQADETDSDGIVVGASIDLNTGTIKSAATGIATLLALNSVGSTAGVLVDSTPPALIAPTVSQMGANQVTLTLQSSETGRGYFTLLPGTGAAPGTGTQVKAGQNSSGASAFRFGSRLLAAATSGTYTIRNLTAGTAYTVCFTADDMAGTVQSTPLTVSFTTAAAANLTGLDWGATGGFGFSAGAVSSPSLAFAPDGTPHVAYTDVANGDKVTVMMLAGGSWTTVGSAGFSAGGTLFPSLAFAPDGTPYVCFCDFANVGKATVMKFNGSAWVLVGTAGFSADVANYSSLAFAPDSTPYLAYRDSAQANKATVAKFDGSAWVPVGAAGFSAGSISSPSLAFAHDGSPYLAYGDAGNGDKATVMRFNGAAWSEVGTAGFSAGGAQSTSLVFAPDGTPHVVYRDAANGDRATLMNYSGGTWNAVGGAGFTSLATTAISLAFGPDGTPYVAHSSGHPAVMRYGGGTWSSIGTSAPSVSPENIAFAVAPDGSPYLAIRDLDNAAKATVVKLSPVPTPTVQVLPLGGTYTTGQNLDFLVEFNAIVTVSGSPRFIVTIGGIPRYATFVERFSATALRFRYTAEPGLADTDGITVGATIDLNGGTLKDTLTGAASVLTLSCPLSTSGVLVDSGPPVVSSILRQAGTPSWTTGTSAVWRVTFSEPVTGVTADDFALMAAGTASGSVGSVTAADSRTYDVTVSSLAGGGNVRLDLKSSGTGIADLAGNAITGGFAAGQSYVHFKYTSAIGWGPNMTRVDMTGALVGKTVVELADGAYHRLALASDGQVFSWGSNSHGELGIGSTTTSNNPVAVTTAGTPLSGKTVVGVAAGDQHSLVVASDGRAYAWGANGAGQLGDGASTNRTLPVAVTTAGTPLAGKTVVAVSAGYLHSLALTSDGLVFAWGENTFGQLGNLTTASSTVPVAVSTSGGLAGKTVVAIAAGRDFSMALTSDGRVYAWGVSNCGQTGGGSNPTYVTQPWAVDTSGPLAGKSVVAIAAGANHGEALTSDGQVVAWGYNAYGQVGDNSTTNQYAPVLVGGLLSGQTVVAIAAGAGHSQALTSDGRVFTWGDNTYGELGDGTTTSSPTPVAASVSGVLAGKTVIALAPAPIAFHTLVLIDGAPPAFIDATAGSLSVDQDSGAADLKALLHVRDFESGRTLTWSQGTAPGHGTLALSGAQASTGGADIAPGGTITYTPNTGYAGYDTFSVTVSNGIDTATRTLSVTVMVPTPVVVAPAAGSSTNNNQPAISGTSVANATIFVGIDGAYVGMTTANGAGEWTLALTAALSDGAHTAAAMANTMGHDSGYNNYAFTVDTAVPATPSTPVTTAVVTMIPRPAISGTAEAGCTIKLYDGTTLVGTTTAGSDGTWNVAPASDLNLGSHTLTVTVTDAAGNVSAASAALRITIGSFHAADFDHDWRISLIELTRVIELYNTRSGTARTGEYHTQPGTEDGFAPGPGAVTERHSGDTNQDGRIDLLELTRVIELYNTRSGTTRTGEYRVQSDTEDDYTPVQ